jgi:N-acetylglutamate synthase/N-acetylornithine aminotransferase
MSSKAAWPPLAPPIARRMAQRVMVERDHDPGQPAPRSHAATIWTCDLSYDYVEINADYRS